MFSTEQYATFFLHDFIIVLLVHVIFIFIWLSTVQYSIKIIYIVVFFTELMKICIWLYENESASTDKLTLLKVMEGVVRCSRERESFHKPSSITKVLCSVAKFLKTTLSNSSGLSSQYGLQSALLSLLLTFTKAVSILYDYMILTFFF